MAYALIAHTFGASGSSATTASINTTGANLIVISVSTFGTPSTASLSDSKGNTYTQLTPQSGAVATSRLFYCLAPTVGSGHTFTYGAGFPTICVQAWSGAATSSVFDVENGAAVTAVTSIQPGSVTPGAANELVVTGLGLADTTTGTVAINGGYTISDQSLGRTGQSESGAMAYLVQTSATATNPTWSSFSTDSPSAVIAAFKAAAGGGPVSVALTGISGTGSLGTLGKSVSHAITGVSGTGSLGTLGKSVSHPLTGVSGTGSLGTLGKSVRHALTGVSGTGALGTLTPATGSTVALTGISGTGSLGTLTAKTSHALTGVQGTGSLGTLTPTTNKNVALTGISGTGSLGTLGKSIAHGLTGVQATGFMGTMVPSTSGPVTLALTGIQGRGFLGTLGIGQAAAIGGHFLPLTEKQIRELKKRERKNRQHQDDLDDAKKLDAAAIEADIRREMFPAGKVDTPITNVETGVDTDDEDEDLEFILLHA